MFRGLAGAIPNMGDLAVVNTDYGDLSNGHPHGTGAHGKADKLKC
jgi:hypothetical protein